MALAAVAREAADLQMAALITVAAFTGLRLGELRALRWADIEFTGRSIIVRRNLPSHGEEKTPKSGKVRSVPLIDQAAVALDGLSRREHFTGAEERVFPSPTGGAFDDGKAREEFHAALERAGSGGCARRRTRSSSTTCAIASARSARASGCCTTCRRTWGTRRSRRR